jgi:hypothetical protein
VFDLLDFEFSREKWTSALRSCRLSASVLVEVPIPVLNSENSSEGTRALHDAVEAFEHGGTTAWKDTVGHIRPFLENWKKCEPLQQEEPRDGSPADRKYKLLNLRDALHKCCHFWVHEPKAACNRNDALLALSTLALLLESLRGRAA